MGLRQPLGLAAGGDGRGDAAGFGMLDDADMGMAVWLEVGDLPDDCAVAWPGGRLMRGHAHPIAVSLARCQGHGRRAEGEATNPITKCEPGARVHVSQ